MDTVSTFVEDEDADGGPETYYYSSEGGENREGRKRASTIASRRNSA